MERELYILTGCTGVGKTEWSIRWAKAHNAEIISCDSLLFYRGMDIGAAKPTSAERGAVPHHLIDIADVRDRMDIARYTLLARAAADGIHARRKKVLVCGGSGFYLASFFRPVADSWVIPDAIKEAVAHMSAEVAVEKLRGLNPLVSKAFDWDNPRRVVRALERCLASGKSIDELAAAFAAQPGAFDDWKICLTQIMREPDDHMQQIRNRVQRMLEAGLIAEVENLRAAGLAGNASAANAIGYREVLDYLNGGIPLHLVGDKIAKNTRSLVKKQRTWFRTQLPVHRQVYVRDIRTADDIFSASEGSRVPAIGAGLL